MLYRVKTFKELEPLGYKIDCAMCHADFPYFGHFEVGHLGKVYHRAFQKGPDKIGGVKLKVFYNEISYEQFFYYYQVIQITAKLAIALYKD